MPAHTFTTDTFPWENIAKQESCKNKSKVCPFRFQIYDIGEKTHRLGSVRPMARRAFVFRVSNEPLLLWGNSARPCPFIDLRCPYVSVSCQSRCWFTFRTQNTLNLLWATQEPFSMAVSLASAVPSALPLQDKLPLILQGLDHLSLCEGPPPRKGELLPWHLFITHSSWFWMILCLLLLVKEAISRKQLSFLSISELLWGSNKPQGLKWRITYKRTPGCYLTDWLIHFLTHMLLKASQSEV
jgi:hypothetical protein